MPHFECRSNGYKLIMLDHRLIVRRPDGRLLQRCTEARTLELMALIQKIKEHGTYHWTVNGTDGARLDGETGSAVVAICLQGDEGATYSFRLFWDDYFNLLECLKGTYGKNELATMIAAYEGFDGDRCLMRRSS